MSRPQTVECLAEAHRKGWAFADDFELNAKSWKALRILERNGEIRIEGGLNCIVTAATAGTMPGDCYCFTTMTGTSAATESQ